MAKEGRAWFPLDVNFWRDPKVIEAGERAAVLYLAMLGQIRLNGHHGTITGAEMARLGITGHVPRLQRLLAVGLVAPLIEDVYVLPAWEDWQPDKTRAAYMRAWREQRKGQARIAPAPDWEPER
jgi:hypothetical protein